jgi:recombination protein RecT
VYAYAVLFNGATSHVVRMGAAEVAKHRAVSKSGDAFWGPAYPAEGPWTPSMWLKTGLHALERWVPTSAAYRWEVAASQAKVAMDPVRPPAPDRAAEPIDAEVLEDDTGWPDVAQPPADPKVIT